MPGNESGKTVVLIDDDDGMVQSLGNLLRDAGFRVRSARNARDGVRLARDSAPDMIVCDIMMETVDAGVNAAREMREAGVRAPIFLLSVVGDGLSQTVDTGELDIAGTLQKPLELDAFLDLAKSVTGQK